MTLFNLLCTCLCDSMSFCLYSPTIFSGHAPFDIRRTSLTVLPPPPWAKKSEILITNNLRYRKTIVQLGNIDILWPDINHLVCLLRRCLRSLDGGKALSLV